MRELLRTNDPVLVSVVGALLGGAAIRHVVLDQNMSVLEGSIGILPRRVMVAEEDWRSAVDVLRGGGVGEWVSRNDA